MHAAIVETGPLVIFLDQAERHHCWAVDRIGQLDPLLVCEPILAEAMYLLARFSDVQDALFGLLATLRKACHGKRQQRTEDAP